MLLIRWSLNITLVSLVYSFNVEEVHSLPLLYIGVNSILQHYFKFHSIDATLIQTICISSIKVKQTFAFSLCISHRSFKRATELMDCPCILREFIVLTCPLTKPAMGIYEEEGKKCSSSSVSEASLFPWSSV